MSGREAACGIVGILGGGQLGQMLAQAGASLGIRARAFDPKSDACAANAADLFTGRFNDPDALTRFADGLEWVTFEWENVPVSALEKMQELGKKVFPSPRVLEITQDRLHQKKFFASHSIETAPFAEVSTEEDLETALRKFGFPLVLKTRREGYDGKGQLLLRQREQASGARQKLGSVPLIAEGFIPFQGEVSIVASRSRAGEIAFYPLTWNFHRQGILRWSIAPAPLGPAFPVLQGQAEAVARRALEALDYIGTLAIEFFVFGGRLLVNELAPRVHNSGHWTQDGAITSQFENHLRAGMGEALGIGLGSTALKDRAAGMVNLVGELPDEARFRELLRDLPGTKVHLYGKSPAPGRKIGHLNFIESSIEGLRERMGSALALLGEAPPPSGGWADFRSE